MDGTVFEQACLIQLSASCWQGSRMLDASVMEQIGDSEWLRGRKYLVDQETLNPIRSTVGRARKDLEKGALPFPITGLTLVPKEQLAVIEGCLKKHQRDFWREVDIFEAGYEKAREIARGRLGEFFSEHDYPLNIRGKFGFEWRYFTLETPGKYGILTPEIFEREKQKFHAMMEETRELAISALREEFVDHVSHIVERLTHSEDGKPKVFKNCMLEKIQGYLDSFDARNLFGDARLAEMVGEAKLIMNGVSPQSIREDATLKQHIAEGMAKIKEAIDQAVTDLPRRKIRFAA